MPSPESGQVREIIINTNPRYVSPLEKHLRGLRQQMDMTSNEFAVACGINPGTYALLENKGNPSRKNATNIMEMLGEDPALEVNPHAEAVVTILSLKNLYKRKRRRIHGEGFYSDQNAPKLKKLEQELPVPFEGEVIFRRGDARMVQLNVGFDEVEARTQEEKWQDTLAQLSFGAATRFRRLEMGLPTERFARKLDLPAQRMHAVEKGLDVPTTDEVSAIVQSFPFEPDSPLIASIQAKASSDEPLLSLPLVALHENELLTALAAQSTIGEAFKAVRDRYALSLRELGLYFSDSPTYKVRLSGIERGRIQLPDYEIATMCQKMGFDIHHPVTHIFLGIHDAQEAA